MSLPFGFDDFLTDLTKLQDLITQVHAEALPSKEKDLLGQYLAHMVSSRADVERTYPEAIGAIHNSMSQTEAGIAAGQAELAKAMQQATAAVEQAQLPSVPVTPEVKLDPQLGTALRAELLALCGQRRSDLKGDGIPLREAWQDWEHFRHP